MDRRFGTLTAAALSAALAVGVARTASSQEPVYRSAAELPDHLLAQLPANALAAGLDYAPRLVHVFTPTREQRQALADSGLDVTEHGSDQHLDVVLWSADDETFVTDVLGLDFRTRIPDLIAREQERILADAEFFRANESSLVPSGRTTYRQLADYGAEIDALVAANPDLAKRISLGTSVEGRDLTGIELAVGVNEPDDGRPVFLMFGNHHAREWPSAEAPMEFAHDLVQNFNATDARTIDLLTRTRVVIVPVSNPDGYNASRVSGDLVDLNVVDGGGTVAILGTPGNAYKRKNCSVQDAPQPPEGCIAIPSPGGFGIGTDLNRNYGALWGGPGTDATFEGATYHGPAPFSEPETQAIRTLISTRQVTTVITNHTFGNLLLRPVGVQPDTIHPDGDPVGFAPDECFTTADGIDNGMQALGERMTAQTGYSNQFGWELYDTTGTTEDYSYNATGGYGYTFEIGPDEFHPPFEEWTLEYLGTSASASGLTPETATFLTTGTAKDCEAEAAPHETVGGGLREAFYLALENAADAGTHAVLTGTAPEGAEISVTRSGDFPIWDGSGVPDTVTTTMTVPAGDRFEYHVNPSTRPFVASRSFVLDAGEPPTIEAISTETIDGGPTLPNMPDDIPIDVPEGTDSIRIEMSATFADDYDLALITPDLVTVSASAEGGSDEVVEFTRASGIQPGQWVARVTNFAAVGPWSLEVTLGEVVDPGLEPLLDETPGDTESWTVTCTIDGVEEASQDLVIGRGESQDLGTFCGTAAGAPAPAPTPEPTPAPEPAPNPLPATGAGLGLAGLLALGAATRLRRWA